MLCKLVAVTALSSNHFAESQDYFGCVHAKLPNTKIIVYDLGLTAEQVKTIQGYCNVREVRPFQFDHYPKHTRDLRTYAWKIFIVNEMSKEFELFFYCDSSCRIKDVFFDSLPNVINNFPLLPGLVLSPRNAIRYAHDGMLKYHVPKRTKLHSM